MKKILAILVSMLFITMIPSAIGEIVNPESNDSEPCLDIGRFWYSGLVLFPHYSDGNLTFFAIRLFYMEITPTEGNCGFIIFRWVTLENFTGRINTGPFNIIGWI